MFTTSRRLRVTGVEEHDILTKFIVLLLLLFLKLLRLPFNLLCLPLQLIHLFDEAGWTFLFSNKLFPKRSLYRCLCSEGACPDTGILKKKRCCSWPRDRSEGTLCPVGAAAPPRFFFHLIAHKIQPYMHHPKPNKLHHPTAQQEQPSQPIKEASKDSTPRHTPHSACIDQKPQRPFVSSFAVLQLCRAAACSRLSQSPSLSALAFSLTNHLQAKALSCRLPGHSRI
jgi:hypothetical protein